MVEVFESESVRVTRRLRDEIIDGVRPPGSRLVERELAEELQVSRVPVREALRVLTSEGLVTPRPRSWAVVREFTPDDVAELTEVREALEVLTFRLAAVRRDQAGLDRLREAWQRESEAAAVGDGVAARRAAADFHEVATDLAGNSLLSELGDTLRSRMRWLLGQHDDLSQVTDEHAALLAAVADGDSARAATLAEEHLQRSREWVARVR
ncbi:GntR family transcriptional regulator [Ruania alba]|uniref:DNA-binding transcriptional regulator, GntR family n=1 Tax=Ruania alba TaxID=648782 RepID=A0A1H5EV14_9MICO|nr:GntR family transcriptional regulator [Ruania alba]SED94941.1 DNA-binding transcriptional regulator, GntR family [Ruania alba]